MAIGVLDGSVAHHPASVIVRGAYIVALTYVASAAARFRWDYMDAQAELHHRLAELADHDGLTGLLNHRAFHQQLAARLDGATQTRRAVSVLLVDLDLFKAVNDTHGHLVGDRVLRAAAGALRKAVRDGDVVARVGGEEFAVLLPDAGPEEATVTAEAIRAAIAAIGDPVAVTASIGVSSGTGLSAGELLDQADGALYTAKRQGRNRVCWLRAA